jgi:hypothetical protein
LWSFAPKYTLPPPTVGLGTMASLAVNSQTDLPVAASSAYNFLSNAPM